MTKLSERMTRFLRDSVVANCGESGRQNVEDNDLKTGRLPEVAQSKLFAESDTSEPELRSVADHSGVKYEDVDVDVRLFR